MTDYQSILDTLRANFAGPTKDGKPSEDGVEFTGKALEHIAKRYQDNPDLAYSAAQFIAGIAEREGIKIVNVAFFKSPELDENLVVLYSASDGLEEKTDKDYDAGLY